MHGLPTVERLTFLAHGRRWVDQQWLSQLLLYELERLGGVGAVVALGAAAFLIALAIAAFVAQSQGASPYSLLFWSLAVFLVEPSAAGVRTQSLVVPLFSVILWLIVRDPNLQRRSSLLALPVLCLWANLHGSVVLVAAIVAAHGLQALLRRRASRRIAATLMLSHQQRSSRRRTHSNFRASTVSCFSIRRSAGRLPNGSRQRQGLPLCSSQWRPSVPWWSARAGDDSGQRRPSFCLSPSSARSELSARHSGSALRRLPCCVANRPGQEEVRIRDERCHDHRGCDDRSISRGFGVDRPAKLRRPRGGPSDTAPRAPGPLMSLPIIS